MSARFTNNAGTAALVGAAIWLAVAATYWVAQDAADDWGTAIFLLWTISIMAAGVLTLVAALGIRERSKSFRRMGTVGIVILGVGVVSSFISWATPLWMTVEGIGMLLVALAARSTRPAPRLALALYGSGMLFGSVSFGVLTAMKVGARDMYGDYPLAWGISFTVGLVIVAVGLLGIGTWLRGDEPVGAELPPQRAAI